MKGYIIFRSFRSFRSNTCSRNGYYIDTCIPPTCEICEICEICEKCENYVMTEENLRKLDEIHEHSDVMSTLRDIAVLQVGWHEQCNQLIQQMRESDRILKKAVEALIGQPVDWDNGKE